MTFPFKKILKGVKTYVYQQPIYYSYYKKLNIQKGTLLFECTHGQNISGHLFYLLKEVREKQPHLRVYVAAQQVQEVEQFLKVQKVDKVQVVKHLSRHYLKLLASAEILVNDTSFYSFFIKKKGQKYFNIWHGTPLKTLGKDVENITDGANVQRNFYMADKIITSNAYTTEILASSHGLKGVYQGQMIIGPSPRNSILLDKEKRLNIREQLGMTHQKVSFYMPTWRGVVGNITNTNDKTLEDLRYLSKHLSKEEHFFVKLHPFQQTLDLSEFSNISPMPSQYELYEFLTAVDILITDYSSIMYDFLLTNQKIILYTYDKDVYFRTRGVYENIDDYPFVQVETIEELVTEIKKPITVMNYEGMKAKFCPVDHLNGTSILWDYLFENHKHEKIQELNLNNGKETAIILGGGFWDNGVTTALLNTLDNIDLNKRNYMILVGQTKLKKEFQFRIKNLQDEIIFYPIPETITSGILDRFLYLASMKFNGFYGAWIERKIGKVLVDDFYRLVGDLKINHFIHYTGFGNRYGELIKHVPTEVNRVMYVHTDMIKEYEAKKNFNKKITFSAYEAVDKVALVHSNLKHDLIKELPSIEEKLYVVNNFLGEKRIRQLANEDLYGTLCHTALDFSITDELFEPFKGLSAQMSRLLRDVLDSKITVFINIGRYDYQKGHDRLIAAFEKVYLKNPQTRLIILAPHGPLRNQTIEWAQKSPASHGIYLLGRMGNPYALLKACDAFVLSSNYEGLGLVVYEALAVGTDVITVNLTETVQYLQNHEVMIVDNSVLGIQEGMLQYLTTDCIFNEFDFSKANQRSLKEFENLFK